MRPLRIHRLLKQDPVAEERNRIETLLTAYDRFVRQQFEQFLSSVRDDPELLEQIATAIADGRVNDAYKIVDSYVVRLAENIVSQIPDIGRYEAESLEFVGGAGVGISFNSSSPEVVELMQRNRLQFIRDFTTDQRMAVNQALSQASRDGLGPEETARAFRDAVGLTSYQQGMVDSYRTQLETNSRQALDRAYRDRRYDRGFENAIANDEILPDERIDLMVDRYRDRLLQARGETIARTESHRIAEEVRNLSVYQAADKAGIDYRFVVKQWLATRDSRTRDTHAAMDGQARLLEDSFDSPSGTRLMVPGDENAPAGETINCRCTVAHHFFDTLEEAMAFVEENGQGRY